VAAPPGVSDAALISQSCKEPERFAVLFDRHAAGIHRYLARRVGPDSADDLVAETFLIAFKQRARFDVSRADARPWLYGIATNLVGRHRRDEIRFFRAIARTGNDPAAGLSARGAADGAAEPLADGVTRRVVAQGVRKQLAAALGGLAKADRDVLLLIAAGGFSYQEVALALGVPVGTVSSRLARARRKVREALGGVDPTATEEDFRDE
jgi:RNA polymerase sigma-70 factor, ECF subfamily